MQYCNFYIICSLILYYRMDKIDFLVLFYISLPVPQPIILIKRNYSGLIFAGNTFTLNAEILLNISAVMNVSLSLTISWSKDGDNIITSNNHITISNVSDSESGYTASLTYSPIATSDSGLITATVTVSPSDDSMYIQSVTATANDTLCIQGKNLLYNIILYFLPTLRAEYSHWVVYNQISRPL